MDRHLAITLNSKKIGLDVRGGETNYISHAHTDHSYPLKDFAPIFCSDETAALLNLQKEKRIPAPANFKLENAGHILGSTQLIADTAEFGRLVYTGDFKLKEGLTTKPAKIIECNTLIMECTYGNPAANFGDPRNTFDVMQKWHKQNSDSIQIWGGYSVGKAQELVKFLNQYAHTAPIVPPKIAKICSCYKHSGVHLDFISSDSDEAQQTMRSPFCAVFPPHQLSRSFAFQISQAHRRKAKIALATGWTGLRRLSCDISFPLSDHADFSQLLEYASSCGAKKVFLAHGDNEACASHLRQRGINAHAVEKIEKKEMMQVQSILKT